MARIQDLILQIKCDIPKCFARGCFIDTPHETGQPRLCGNISHDALERLNRNYSEGKPRMKKLYKVFVIVQGEIHEQNVIADTHEGAKFDAVKQLNLDVSFDSLDVYALEIFTLKKNCC